MAENTGQRYPNIDRFVFEYGWIEIGSDDNSGSFVRRMIPAGQSGKVKSPTTHLMRP